MKKQNLFVFKEIRIFAMTVIIFLIDTSASMMQKSYLGTTLLDFARLTVEQFLKQRQRDPASSGDRYMLMTFEEYPYNIKSGWKESQRVFNEQLKGLRAKGVANFEQSVESVMRLLTINRMQTGVGAGIENYGFGRFPSYTEHVVIVPVVDGSELPTDDPAANVPKPRLLVGNDFTTEAFRWDQRMFPIVLRLAGHQRLAATAPSSFTASTTAAGVGTPQQQQMVPLPDRSIAESFATQMGGRSFAITSHRTLFLCIDTIMQRIQFNGVFVWFRKHGQDPSPPPPPITATSTEDAQQLQQKDETVKDKSPALGAADAAAVGDDCWTNTLVLVKAKPGSGPSFWPIPEAFWPDTVRNSLPARPAHPVVMFHCERAEPMFNPEFPLDKYELDSSTPLVQFMLSRREPNLCWQVFVEGSFKQPGVGLPFGYLKVSSASTVNLLVMPYNYPDLLTLLAQAKEGAKMIASVPFQQRFDKYLNTVPPYYYTYLKKQLNRLKIAPPSLEEANTKLYGYINMGTHHAKMKQQGLQEFELACMAVQKCLSDPTNINAAVFGANPAAFVKLSRARALLGKAMPLTADCAPSFRPALGFLPSLQPQLLPPTGPDLTIFVPYAAGGAAGGGAIIQSSASTSAVPPSQLFKNPFDIPRANLCAQLDKMRINFEQQVRGGNGGGGCNDLHVFQGGPPGQKIKLQHAEDLANLPISKMGVYEDYVKSLIAIGMGPKRELEPQAARPHAFGNPFKLDKKSNMYIADEVGEMNAGASTSAPSDGSFSSTANGGGSGRRRRAGSEAGTLATGVRPPRRRPGPIDPNRLAMWRRRRRSSSVISCPEEATTASSSSIEMAATNSSFDAYEERAPLRMVEEEEDDEVGLEEGKDDEQNRQQQQPMMMEDQEAEQFNAFRNQQQLAYEDAQKEVEEDNEWNAGMGPSTSSLLSSSNFDSATASNGGNSSSSTTIHCPTRRGGRMLEHQDETCQLLEKQRQIRRIVRLKGPTILNLAERVASTATSASTSRKRTRELFELGIAEARRFKRAHLCELIGQRLQQQQRQGVQPAVIPSTNNNNTTVSSSTSTPVARHNGYR